jgi:hypothetical protein
MDTNWIIGIIVLAAVAVGLFVWSRRSKGPRP